MGLLGNILSGAIGDGLRDAVGKVVEKAVTPAAQRMAEKQAAALDNVAKKTEEAMAEVNAAAAAAESAPAEGVAPEGAAPETASPEGAAPRQMTPEEKEQAAKAAQALKGFGMMFEGAIARAKKEAEAEEAARVAAEAAIFDNWSENLPAYPVWDVGGSKFELEEVTPMNGHPAFNLRLTGRPFLVEQYAAKLRADGFVAKGCSNPADLNADTYYKMIDGVCHAFNRTDACYDGHINVSFYVDNYVPKPRQEPRQQQAPTDLKDVAKSIFKKFF